MDIPLENILLRVYYLLVNNLINKRVISIPDYLKYKKNLFLYYDFEGQFGGHYSSLSDSNITEILYLLDQYGFKTTWFVVGRVLDVHYESVAQIIDFGHEIGSHTYNHCPPYKMDKHTLKKDFLNFRFKSDGLFTPLGFHSPNGKWSFKLLKYLSQYSYQYDVINTNNNESYITLIKSSYRNSTLFRFTTLGDDWNLYNKCSDKHKALEHFIKLYNKLNSGSIGGIGVHPWVLFSKKSIWEGYKLFLDYLSKQDDLFINCASDFVSKLGLVNTIRRKKI